MMTTDSKTRINEFGQPIGFALPDWKPPPFPPHVPLQGRYCRLEPLSAAKHARDVFEAQREDTDGRALDLFVSWALTRISPTTKPGALARKRHAIRSSTPSSMARAVAPLGTCTYMRIEPRHGVIEVGNIYFSPRLARTRAATEAMYLLMANAFDLGYRRYEWKCDSCNLPSRAAATRFGFTYEGLFRQAIVNKGRNRDTSWFSIIDGDWNGGLKDAYLRWLVRRQLRRERRAEAAAVGADGAVRAREVLTTARLCVSSGGEERFHLFRQTLRSGFERSRVDARHGLFDQREAIRLPGGGGGFQCHGRTAFLLSRVPTRHSFLTTFGRAAASSTATAAPAPAPNKSTCRKRMESRKSPMASA